MEKPMSEKNDPADNSFSTGTGDPVKDQIPKGNAMSVPGGVPEPNIIPR